MSCHLNPLSNGHSAPSGSFPATVLFSPDIEGKKKQDLLRRIEELQENNAIWLKIAEKEGINISKEERGLQWLQSDCASGPEELRLIRLEKCQRHHYSRIRKKVRKNIHKDAGKEVVDDLVAKLATFTNEKMSPWVLTANRENVDISEEFTAIKEALLSGLEYLREKDTSYRKEVVYRRQLALRTACIPGIIHKVYVQRIESLAEHYKSKDYFDDERCEVIDGLRREALARLPERGQIESMERVSNELFTIYKGNLELFDANPEAYHAAANKEWAIRQITQIANQLARMAGKNEHLVQQIGAIRRTALQMLENGESLEGLRESVNQAYDILRERMTGQYSSCGKELLFN